MIWCVWLGFLVMAVSIWIINGTSNVDRVNLALAGFAVGFLILVFGTFGTAAFARDLGQWKNQDPVIRKWYQTLMRPDMPNSPCCGEADAYWADEVHVRDGKTFATITDDRDDGPLRRPHIPIGTEIQIPDVKLKWSDGNPTGHAILFMSAGGFVYCFVQAGGT